MCAPIWAGGIDDPLYTYGSNHLPQARDSGPMDAIHCFDNGVKVYDEHLVEAQRIRYAKCNVHEEDEEELFLEMVRGLAPGARFVSLGTAIGYYVLLAKRVRPDLIVHCFEPLERHRNFLMANIKLNGFSDADFWVHDLAVAPGDTDYLLVDRSFGSFLVRPEDAGARPVSQVKSVALSKLGPCIGSDQVDLVQMDVQGFEAAILEEFVSAAAGRLSVKAFLIGTHGEAIHKRCRSALVGAGYECLCDQFHTVNQPDGILAAMHKSG